MSFLAGSIIGTLGLETGGFTQGFLKAEALTNTFPSIITNFMANPLLGLAGLAKSVFSEIAGTMKEAFDASQENADKLNDMATNAGVAVDALSGLGLAASQAGSSTESVADSFKFLGKNIAEAMDGNKEAVTTFGRLGVAFQDVAGNARPLEDVWFDLSDALASMDSPAQRTQVAMGLLGRSGTDLLATLTQGSAALKDQIAGFDRYGAVVSANAAKSADAFGDLLGEVKIAWSGIQNLIGEPLREELTPVLQDMLSWIQEHQGEIRSFISGLVSLTVGAIETIISAVERLKSTLAGAGIGAALGGIVGGLPGAAIGGVLGASIGNSVGAMSEANRPLQIQINSPAFDTRDASSQVANKLTPVIKQSYAQGLQASEVAAQRALVESGL